MDIVIGRLPESTSETPGATSDVGNQVTRSQVLLVHAELDGGDRIGVAEGVVLVFVNLDQGDEHFKLFLFGRPIAGIHQFGDTCQGGFVVGFGAKSA